MQRVFPNANNDRILWATRLAKVNEDIEKLEKGFETPLGDVVADIKPAMKQKLAIARAIIRNPKILVLDDVFANLDTLFLIIQGGDLPQLAMTAAIVGTFVFVMINSFDCLDDFKANTDDMDEEEAATNLGSKFKSAPWGFFKVVITLIFGAIAATQLIEVW